MNLSAKQFAEIVSTFEGGILPPQDEKRHASRVIHTCSVPIIFDHNAEDERRETVTVVDLSSRGVGLLYRNKVRRGQQFVLQFNRAKGEPTLMLCIVAHCRRHGKGIFAVGAEFTCVLNEKAKQDPAESARDIVRIRDKMFS